jgi:hypothetical protein
MFNLMTEPDEKKRFLTVHNYGMGGIWMYITAQRAGDITEAYPELEVFGEPPSFLDQAELGQIERDESYDLEEPPRGYLKGLLDRRNK